MRAVKPYSQSEGRSNFPFDRLFGFDWVTDWITVKIRIFETSKIFDIDVWVSTHIFALLLRVQLSQGGKMSIVIHHPSMDRQIRTTFRVPIYHRVPLGHRFVYVREREPDRMDSDGGRLYRCARFRNFLTISIIYALNGARKKGKDLFSHCIMHQMQMPCKLGRL